MHSGSESVVRTRSSIFPDVGYVGTKIHWWRPRESNISKNALSIPVLFYMTASPAPFHSTFGRLKSPIKIVTFSDLKACNAAMIIACNACHYPCSFLYGKEIFCHFSSLLANLGHLQLTSTTTIPFSIIGNLPPTPPTSTQVVAAVIALDAVMSAVGKVHRELPYWLWCHWASGI